MTSSPVAMTPKELHESYLAKAIQAEANAAEANAAAATDPVTKENWQGVAETFRQLAKRLK